MRLLLFQAGNDWYGIDAGCISEVIPYLAFKSIPGTPGYIPGLIQYRNSALPVLDITALITGVPTRPLYSSRIVIIDYTRSDEHKYKLGLLTEKATETIVCSEDMFHTPVVTADDSKYLGDIMTDERGIIQRIDIARLIPHDLAVRLFGETEVAGTE